MLKSTHYELNLVEGTDTVNPLVIDRPNYEKIDEQMFNNSNAAIQTATELYDSGLKVHALTLTTSSTVFRFVATSAYTSGDTFTVNGQQVTALLPSGETLSTGAYVINSTVLCALNGTVLTLYLGKSKVALSSDSEKLGGNLPGYYGTKVEIEATKALAESAVNIANDTKEKVGMDILWRNPNAIGAFEPTTLALDLSKYRFVTAYARASTTDNSFVNITIPVQGNIVGGLELYSITADNRTIRYLRPIQILSGLNGIQIYGESIQRTNPYEISYDKTILIPQMIVGIK